MARSKQMLLVEEFNIFLICTVINYYVPLLATLLGLPADFGKKNKIFKLDK